MDFPSSISHTARRLVGVGCLVVLSQDGPHILSPSFLVAGPPSPGFTEGLSWRFSVGRERLRSEEHQPISQMRKIEAWRAEGLCHDLAVLVSAFWGEAALNFLVSLPPLKRRFWR